MLCHELTVPAPPTGASGMQLADRLARPGTVLRELLGASFALKNKAGPGSPRSHRRCACRDGVGSSMRRERAKEEMACGATFARRTRSWSGTVGGGEATTRCDGLQTQSDGCDGGGRW